MEAGFVIFMISFLTSVFSEGRKWTKTTVRRKQPGLRVGQLGDVRHGNPDPHSKPRTLAPDQHGDRRGRAGVEGVPGRGEGEQGAPAHSRPVQGGAGPGLAGRVADSGLGEDKDLVLFSHPTWTLSSGHI